MRAYTCRLFRNRPVGAETAEEVALFDFETDVIQGRKAPVLLRYQIDLDDRHVSRFCMKLYNGFDKSIIPDIVRWAIIFQVELIYYQMISLAYLSDIIYHADL